MLASGSQSDYFGNASLVQHAFGLKELDEGLAVRNRILMRFEEARWIDDPERRRTLLTFAVVGGGPTGVEALGATLNLPVPSGPGFGTRKRSLSSSTPAVFV